MAEEASVGLSVKIGWLIGVHIERDPDALLLRARTLLGTNSHAGHIITSRARCARNPSAMVLKLQKGPARAGFLAFFLTEAGVVAGFIMGEFLRSFPTRSAKGGNRDERTTEGR